MLNKNEFTNLYKNIDSQNEDLKLVDFRSFEKANEGFIKNSIILPKNIPFEKYIGNVFHPYTKLLIVSDNEDDGKEIMSRLKTISYSGLGYIPFNLVQKDFSIDLVKNHMDLDKVEELIDVRESSEYNELADFKNVHYMKMIWMNYYWRNLDTNKNYTALCAGGIRSYITASFLRTKGIKVDNLFGGISHLRKIGKVIKKI